MIHDTIRGEKMRSKSEVMIANSIYRHALPYKPELPLKCKNGRSLYPDFTILDPRTMEEYIWEHFGIMDDPVYAAEACRKIQTYNDEGYVLGRNLICTFETSETPLSSVVIENIIKTFFPCNDKE